jgi:hypothetical protein
MAIVVVSISVAEFYMIALARQSPWIDLLPAIDSLLRITCAINQIDHRHAN